MNRARIIKFVVPTRHESYPETQSKELRLSALLLEGTHALHGVGHHGDSSWSHLPAAPGVYQPWVPTRQNKDFKLLLPIPRHRHRISHVFCFPLLFICQLEQHL